MGLSSKVWIGISLGVAVTAALIFYFFFYNARLTIVPTPSNATVYINDQAVAGGTPIKLAPGRYQLKVQANGFLSTQEAVSLNISDIKTLPITLRQVPSPLSIVGSVQFPALLSGEQSIVYLGLDGKQFFKVDTALGADGQPHVEPITDSRFTNVASVTWSPDKNFAIIQTTDGKTQFFDFKRYDLLHQEQRDIGSDLRSVAWGPDSQQIMAFQSTPAGDRSLVRWDVATGQLERLIDLRPYQLTNPTLSWSPDGQWVSLVENGLFLYNIATRQVSEVPGTEGVSAASWSPDSRHILVGLDTSLALVDPNQTASGGRLGIRTPVSKTTWTADSASIVAALTTASGKDALERIDAATAGQSAYVYSSNNPLSMTNLMVAKDSSQLWFVSQGTLYNLLLEQEPAK